MNQDFQYDNFDNNDGPKESLIAKILKNKDMCIAIGAGLFILIAAIVIIVFLASQPCDMHIDNNYDGICDKCDTDLAVHVPEEHQHEWVTATCEAPKTCKTCRETEGAELGHTWVDASCTVARKCSRCLMTVGEPLGHEFTEATCTTLKQCKRCSVVDSDPNYGHNWVRPHCESPNVCTKCNATQGEPLQHYFIGGVCIVCDMPDPSYEAPHLHQYDNDCDVDCNTCGENRVVEHAWGEWIVTKEATEAEAGEKARACEECSAVERETIPMITPVDPAIQEILNMLSEFSLPSNYKVHNIVLSGILADTGLITFKEKIVDGDNSVTIYETDNGLEYEYIIIEEKEDGIFIQYVIDYDGEIYEVRESTLIIDSSDGNSTLPPPTSTDIYYDEARGVYVVDPEYFLGMIYTSGLFESGNDDSLLLLFFFAAMLENSEITITPPSLFNPNVTINFTDVDSNEILMTLKSSLTLRGDVKMDFALGDNDITGTLIYSTDSNDNSHVSLTITVADGSGESSSGKLELDITANQNPIIITDAMQEAINEYSNSNNNNIGMLVEEKYGDGIKCSPSCGTDSICIYDNELGGYVTFTVFGSGYCYVKDFGESYDKTKACLGYFDNNNNFVITKHCLAETLEEAIQEKYSDIYACDDDCGSTIVVYDAEFDVYVVFEEDFWNEGYYELETFFDMFKDSPDVDDCIGLIDMTNKTITITEHSEFRAYYNSLYAMDFTVSGVTDDCYLVARYKDTNVYILFNDYGNDGLYNVMGTATYHDDYLYACTVEVDVDNATLTILKHKH